MNMGIKVLQIAIGDGTLSGVTNFFCSYYKHMDLNKITFDFVYCRKNSLGLLQGNGWMAKSKIYELNALKENSGLFDYIRLYTKLRHILKKNSYNIVHINTGNVFVQTCCLFAARNIDVRISHSHSSQSYVHKNNKLKEIIKKIMMSPCKFLIIVQATHLLACSMVAGNYLFGKFGVRSSKFRLIHNAIDTELYKFNSLHRDEVRKREKISHDTLIFGHIGRLAPVKNHMFLIDVFSEIHKKYKNSMLWIVGDGELKEDIRNKIIELELENCVKLFGERKDVASLLQAMDGFIFPSLFEGLSLVVVEAQSTGLPVYCSDNLSDEHKITELVKFLPIKKGKEYWAQYILKDILTKERKDNSLSVAASGYSLCQEVAKLEKFYIDIVRGREYV